MIYFFSWNSHYLVMLQVNAWKDKFLEKYGEFNFLHIKTPWDHDVNFLAENMLSAGFVWEKKLLLFNLWDTSKDSMSQQHIDFILDNINNIPQDNIIVFYSISPDKRGKLFKQLKTTWEHKEFNIKPDSIKPIIQSKYWNKIENNALDLLIKYKSSNIEKIVSEIDKLLIAHNIITQDLIINNIIPELEESIFIFIDDLLNLNKNDALKRLDIILTDTSPYAFYNNLLANIRTTVYIYKLKSLKKSTAQISDELLLGNRAFLINKSYKISGGELKEFYLKLIELDSKMKSGYFLDSDDESFIHELESVILKIDSK